MVRSLANCFHHVSVVGWGLLRPVVLPKGVRGQTGIGIHDDRARVHQGLLGVGNAGVGQLHVGKRDMAGPVSTAVLVSEHRGPQRPLCWEICRSRGEALWW